MRTRSTCADEQAHRPRMVKVVRRVAPALVLPSLRAPPFLTLTPQVSPSWSTGRMSWGERVGLSPMARSSSSSSSVSGESSSSQDSFSSDKYAGDEARETVINRTFVAIIKDLKQPRGRVLLLDSPKSHRSCTKVLDWELADEIVVPNFSRGFGQAEAQALSVKLSTPRVRVEWRAETLGSYAASADARPRERAWTGMLLDFCGTLRKFTPDMEAALKLITDPCVVGVTLCLKDCGLPQTDFMTGSEFVAWFCEKARQLGLRATQFSEPCRRGEPAIFLTTFFRVEVDLMFA